MNVEVTTALISGGVALVVAGGSAAVSLTQLGRERRRWRVDMKTSWKLEVHKKRLEFYPPAFEILRQLSTGSATPVNADIAGDVAQRLNGWLYSSGGMCAAGTTRGAIVELRECCQRWRNSPEDGRPVDFHDKRNRVITTLRRDLDLLGVDSYRSGGNEPMLAEYEKEIG